jgi:hypothetical protein
MTAFRAGMAGHMSSHAVAAVNSISAADGQPGDGDTVSPSTRAAAPARARSTRRDAFGILLLAPAVAKKAEYTRTAAETAGTTNRKSRSSRE